MRKGAPRSFPAWSAGRADYSAVDVGTSAQPRIDGMLANFGPLFKGGLTSPATNLTGLFAQVSSVGRKRQPSPDQVLALFPMAGEALLELAIQIGQQTRLIVGKG